MILAAHTSQRAHPTSYTATTAAAALTLHSDQQEISRGHSPAAADNLGARSVHVQCPLLTGPRAQPDGSPRRRGRSLVHSTCDAIHHTSAEDYRYKNRHTWHTLMFQVRSQSSVLNLRSPLDRIVPGRLNRGEYFDLRIDLIDSAVLF